MIMSYLRFFYVYESSGGKEEISRLVIKKLAIFLRTEIKIIYLSTECVKVILFKGYYINTIQSKFP